MPDILDAHWEGEWEWFGPAWYKQVPENHPTDYFDTNDVVAGMIQMVSFLHFADEKSSKYVREAGDTEAS